MKQFLFKTKVKAFTLVEMLIVLLVISVLLLLFVPNLSKQKDTIKEKGQAAIVKVVESQAEVYEINNTGDATLDTLVSEEYISQEQADDYRAYYEKNPDKTPSLS